MMIKDFKSKITLPFLISFMLIVLMILDWSILDTGTIWWFSLLFLFFIIKFFTVLHLIEKKSSYPKLIAAGISALYLLFALIIGLISFSFWGSNYETAKLVDGLGLFITGYVILFTLFESLVLLLAVSGLSIKCVIGYLLVANSAFCAIYNYLPYFLSLIVYR